MLTRLRGCKRASGLVLAVLTLLGAAGTTLHSHPGDSATEQPGLLAQVPISVIANPDAPSAVFHLHSGSIAQGESCAACLLSNAKGEAAVATAPVPAAPCVPISAAVQPMPLAPALISAGSRSPPTVA
ncbi:MAG: hypothetical protein ACHQQS_07785 [Thermoanaerobaculales bacterium]